jgi:hypothetical protein
MKGDFSDEYVLDPAGGYASSGVAARQSALLRIERRHPLFCYRATFAIDGKTSGSSWSSSDAP